MGDKCDGGNYGLEFLDSSKKAQGSSIYAAPGAKFKLNNQRNRYTYFFFLSLWNKFRLRYNFKNNAEGSWVVFPLIQGFIFHGFSNHGLKILNEKFQK